jgi:hypothetical protein
MANTLSLNFGLDGFGSLSDASLGINPAFESFRIGSSTSQFPGDGTPPFLNLTTGTSGGQANQWYQAQRTVAATSYDLLNLSSASSTLVNGLGQPLQLTDVKWVLIVINNHDGTKKLQVGPQGQSDAWPAWFEAVTANFYDTVYWTLFKACDMGTGVGPAVTGTTNILPVYNPTANPITYSIFIGGN